MEMLQEIEEWKQRWQLGAFWDGFIGSFLNRSYSEQVDLYFRAKACVDHAECELDTYQAAPEWKDRFLGECPPQIKVTVYAGNDGYPSYAMHDIYDVLEPHDALLESYDIVQ